MSDTIKCTVSIVGEPATGKTQLTRLLLGKTFQKDSRASAGDPYLITNERMEKELLDILKSVFEDEMADLPEIELTLIDNAGQIEYRQEVHSNVLSSDTAYLVVDCGKDNYLQTTQQWIDRLEKLDIQKGNALTEKQQPHYPLDIIIVVTKSDLFESNYDDDDEGDSRRNRVKTLKNEFPSNTVFCVSSATKEGSKPLINHFYRDVYRTKNPGTVLVKSTEFPVEKKRSRRRRCIIM